MAQMAKVGEFTKYEKKELTFPEANNSGYWIRGAIVPCSFTPKMVIFYDNDAPELGRIVQGVLLFDVAITFDKGLVYGNGTDGVIGSVQYVKNSSEGMTRFKYDNGNIYISRISSSIYWSNTAKYTFEIYG